MSLSDDADGVFGVLVGIGGLAPGVCGSPVAKWSKRSLSGGGGGLDAFSGGLDGLAARSALGALLGLAAWSDRGALLGLAAFALAGSLRFVSGLPSALRIGYCSPDHGPREVLFQLVTCL